MTTLVRWTPFRELELIDRRLRRMFEEAGLGVTNVPAADVFETPQEYVIELEVPGFEEKDLGLEVTDHTVVVKGEVIQAKEEKEKSFLLHERLEKVFERRFQLPHEADLGNLKATFGKGVLELHAPKVIEAKPRKIAIAKK
jgi:HSP20 family protein